MTTSDVSTSSDGMNSADADHSLYGSGSENSTIAKTSNDSAADSDHYSAAKGRNTSAASSHAFVNKGRTAQRGLRILVILVFLVGIVLVPYFVFQGTSDGETQNFETKYEGLALKVVTSVDDSLRKKFNAIDSINVAVTSYATRSQAIWPQVTVPDFDIKVANILALANSLSIMLLPIVRDAERSAYEQYTQNNLRWLKTAFTRGIFDFPAEGRNRHRGMQEVDRAGNGTTDPLRSLVPPFIWHEDGSTPSPSKGGGEEVNNLYFPVWQNAAPPVPSLINYDLASHPNLKNGILAAVETKKAVMGEIVNNTALLEGFYDMLMGATTAEEENSGGPISLIYYPVFDQFGTNATMVALLAMTIVWQNLFTDVLPPGTKAVTCVIQNECGTSYTFQIVGHESLFVGQGDLHDTRFDYLSKVYNISEMHRLNPFVSRQGAVNLDHDYCRYHIMVYPSEEYVTVKPGVYAGLVALALLCIFLVAITYDCVVQRRMSKSLAAALESRALISSLFPDNVQGRLFEDGDGGSCDGGISNNKNDGDKDYVSHPPKALLKNFLSHGPADKDGNFDGKISHKNSNVQNSNPIADLFPNCTVLFADIAGFTAWSSQREPAQVFVLLQIIFHFFDRIALKYGVFKVETIGDCYVAVTGLPDPQHDHATRMAKFARQCLIKVSQLVHKLETTLGPETGELSMRFGLNSGPVTAGVLRGEKSRFQLFGDTVNFASGMEGSGKKNQIQCSQSTAALLVNAGKEQWISKRKDLVNVKGTGLIQTYWIRHKSTSSSNNESEPKSSSSELIQSTLKEAQSFNLTTDIQNESGRTTISRKSRRLLEWQTTVLSKLLQNVVVKRNAMQIASDPVTSPERVSDKKIPLDEVAETLKLPQFDSSRGGKVEQPGSMDLDPVVENELTSYIEAIYSKYNDNPFHNFEHAAHVTMSASKLLNRIAVPENVNYNRDDKNAIASDLHDYTYGITSDPLTQFAVVFCALIHDVDHRGVDNLQLAQENPEMAEKYKNRSLAEQNSVDIAWDELMKPQYRNVQKCIFINVSELKRFRQLVVNFVMATDIFDSKMKELRNTRWEKAFHMESTTDGRQDTFDYRATIVLEYIMQASDVSHTMQHWHIYTKWNERLFQEMMSAFESGRSTNNPALGWYQGELWFFDNYVIPLGKKLDECNVFGVASDEGLRYALANRMEWATKGEMIVEEMVQRYQQRKSRRVALYDEEDTGGGTGEFSISS